MALAHAKYRHACDHAQDLDDRLRSANLVIHTLRQELEHTRSHAEDLENRLRLATVAIRTLQGQLHSSAAS